MAPANIPPPPQKFRGEGRSPTPKFLRESTVYMYVAEIGISRAGVWGPNPKTFSRRGRDIFWNNTKNLYVTLWRLHGCEVFTMLDVRCEGPWLKAYGSALMNIVSVLREETFLRIVSLHPGGE